SPLELLHHNVFFSSDYRREFEELIGQRRPPSEPTVYLCAEEEQYFLLSNAPPLPGIDWTAEAPRARERIINMLRRFGWTLETVAEAEITPADFAARFPSSKGAIY